MCCASWEGEVKRQDNVLAQTDVDVRWAKKCGESFFGYKNHVKCDSDSEIITGFSVTDASVHDSVLSRNNFPFLSYITTHYFTS